MLKIFLVMASMLVSFSAIAQCFCAAKSADGTISASLHVCEEAKTDTKMACEAVGGIWFDSMVFNTTITPSPSVGPVTFSLHSDNSQARVDRLTGAEYAALNGRQRELEDLKDKIARSHGVHIAIPPCELAMGTCIAIYQTPSDSFEFRGEFILINLPPER